MSTITIKNALKKYGNTTVIEGLNLEIRDGELFTLLGPSGCGKTTLLRMIAGFNSIEGGDFYFGDERINDKDPAKRNIGMVFQNYAVFPHLTVRKNVAFGLNNRKLDKDTVTRETDKFLKMMRIDEYADRLPQNLSGGQQQRVALARALAVKPDVLLMDEPLSNLDAKLRLEMRQAIRNIQRELGITTVYVTHDQEEAMSISDTIAVMDHGVIQHLGAPKEIYQRPANLFVSTFIGRSNILDGKISGGTLLLEGVRLNCDEWQKIPSGDVKVSVRPEEFLICTENDGSCIPGQVTDSIYLGMDTHYMVKLADGSEVLVIQESTLRDNYRVGEQVWLAVNRSKINIFSVDGQRNYLRD